MHRNLDRRVEVLVSITNPAHISEIGSCSVAFDDGTASWRLEPDGIGSAYHGCDGEPLLDMQEYLINATSRRRATAKCRPVPSVSTARTRKEQRRLRGARSWRPAPW